MLHNMPKYTHTHTLPSTVLTAKKEKYRLLSLFKSPPLVAARFVINSYNPIRFIRHALGPRTRAWHITGVKYKRHDKWFVRVLELRLEDIENMENVWRIWRDARANIHIFSQSHTIQQSRLIIYHYGYSWEITPQPIHMYTNRIKTKTPFTDRTKMHTIYFARSTWIVDFWSEQNPLKKRKRKRKKKSKTNGFYSIRKREHSFSAAFSFFFLIKLRLLLLTLYLFLGLRWSIWSKYFK